MPTSQRRALRIADRRFDARPDGADFRDRLFEPTLVEVPLRRTLKEYRKALVPVLDQGTEGACTGFGLATVVHYLLRSRRVGRDKAQISPRMLYEMAKRYDEWPGVDYAGSSARGAMKGWHKHGVCAATLWPYSSEEDDRRLTHERAADAASRPLGAYLRVRHKDLVAMHAAIAEVGILYATANVHKGWDRVGGDGLIPFPDTVLGGHAFAIVGYDERGFWLQNSWGTTWGLGGFALVSYDDWLANGTDVWVARLAVPITLQTGKASATTRSSAQTTPEAYSFADLRPHVISLGNDGALRASGPFGTTRADVDEIATADLPRITAGWRRKRILVYAHGGLVTEAAAHQRLADFRAALLPAEIYPLGLVWRTDYLSTVANILRDAFDRRRPEGALDAAKDFFLDRLDDTLEPLARLLTGKATWDEMKENAVLATSDSRTGGAAILAEHLVALARSGFELHFLGHSAGSILLAPLVQLLASTGAIASGPLKGRRGRGAGIASCTLWAPACTIELFNQCYRPVLEAGGLDRFTLFTLTDKAECDDECAGIYHKSLLYLVANAFESRPRVPLFQEGTPLLGLERCIRADKRLAKLLRQPRCAWVLAPNDTQPGDSSATAARRHGDFDDDAATVQATIARITGAPAPEQMVFERSASNRRERRLRMLAR
jgi:hypothetical protein